MDFDVDLRLVNAQFHESGIVVDEQENVTGVLALTGHVDDRWREAFAAATPSDAPWRLEDSALKFGPIPITEFEARLRSLREHIQAANSTVEGGRYEAAVADRIAQERHERARSEALEALGRTFGRRLSDQTG
jgi:hypothetical protein